MTDLTPGQGEKQAAAPVHRSAVVCDNCRRADCHPRPLRVTLIIEGHGAIFRNLCTACLGYVTETAWREPAPLIGPPPSTRLVDAAAR